MGVGLFNRGFQLSLKALGLRGLDSGEAVNKNTDTLFRYKFRITGRGGPLPVLACPADAHALSGPSAKVGMWEFCGGF